MNIRHLYSNRVELTHLISERNPDIVALNETHLCPSDKFTQQGFTIFRRDRNRRGGGVAIMCRDTLPVSEIKLPQQFSIHEQVTIKIHIRHFPLHITAIYLPPRTVFPLDLFNHLNSFNKCVIVGDINAYHRDLGDIVNNPAGIRLKSFLDNRTYGHIPTGPTRFPTQDNHYNLTRPDKILVRTILTNKVHNVEVLEPLTNSDHCPLLFKLGTSLWSPTTPFRPTIIYKYHDADWEQYQNYINQNLPPPPIINNVEALIRADELLKQVTCDARLRAVPHKLKRPNIKRDLPPDIIRLIKTKRRAHRLFMRTHTDGNRRLYRQLQQDVKNAINDFENRRRLRLATSLDTNIRDKPGTFWKTLKKLNGCQQPTYPLKVNNRYIFAVDDKLEIFRDTLQQIHNKQQHRDFDHAHYEHITHTIQTQRNTYFPLQEPDANEDDNPLTAAFTTREVANEIQNTNNRAAGPDNIHNILIRNYPDQAVEFLTAIYNASFRLGALPPRWKHAHVLLFPKPGKDLTNAANYRPISLTATVCKIMERIIKRRLDHFMETHNTLPDTQAGFRQGIDIIDQILKVLTPIEQGWTQGHTSIMVALDMQRAFDSVWLDGLRYKLTDTGMPRTFVRWISDFVRDRTAQVKINDNLSTNITLHGGVAQGTVLSPILYNIYVADIPQPQIPTIKLGQFADDTILTSTGRSIHSQARLLNNALTRLTTWLDKWRLTINTTKTQVMLLKRRRYPGATIRDRNPIRIKNIRLPYRDKLTYLGVTFNRKLSLNPQADKIRKRIALSSKLLYKVSGRPPDRIGSLPQTNIIIYKSIIRPSIMYASQLFSRMTPSYLRLLIQKERNLIRKAYQLSPYTRNHIPYDLSGIKPLPEYIQRKNIKYVHKSLIKPYTQHLFNPQPHKTRTLQYPTSTNNSKTIINSHP